jgi:diacylglycerol kinase
MTIDRQASMHKRDETASATRPQPPDGYWSGRWFSLRAALTGVAYTIRTQPNARIELLVIPVVALAGWWLQINPAEWAVLGLTVAVILALEAVNTAVEAVVDLVSPDYHPLARRAKDAAAGAMVFAVVGSLWVAAWVFGPRLWELVF